MANGTLKVQNIETSSGSGTITLGQSGETITVPSGVTLSGGVANTPAFAAYLSADQTITDDTWTKININTETLDTDNYYDNVTNYRFTPLVSGKYCVYYGVTGLSSAADTINLNAAIYKNGSNVNGGSLIFNSNQYGGSVSVNEIIDFNGSTDYVEFYLKIDTVSGTPRADANFNGPRTTFAGAYKLIGA